MQKDINEALIVIKDRVATLAVKAKKNRNKKAYENLFQAYVGLIRLAEMIGVAPEKNFHRKDCMKVRS